MRMAMDVKTRNADQCRSHHQKIIKYHNSLKDIVEYYKEHIYGQEVQPRSIALRRTSEEEEEGMGMSFYRIYRRANIFRIEIDAQQLKDYGEE